MRWQAYQDILNGVLEIIELTRNKGESRCVVVVYAEFMQDICRNLNSRGYITKVVKEYESDRSVVIISWEKDL